jgi:biopolymer transport protein ExbD
MTLTKKSTRFQEVPAASMSDIAFLLIIFFMVTSVLVIKEGLITLLPKSGSQPLVLNSKDILKIELISEEQVLINETRYTLAELTKAVRQSLSEGPKTVLLLIDPHCKHKQAVEVIGQLQGLGINKMSIKKREVKDEDRK